MTLRLVRRADAAEIKLKDPAGAGTGTKNGVAVVSSAVRHGSYQEGIPRVAPGVEFTTSPEHEQENNGIRNLKELERLPAPEKAHAELGGMIRGMIADGRISALFDLVMNDAATAIAALGLDKNAALMLMTQTDDGGVPLAELAAGKHREFAHAVPSVPWVGSIICSNPAMNIFECAFECHKSSAPHVVKNASKIRDAMNNNSNEARRADGKECTATPCGILIIL